jgi:uncharacterized membrane protein
MAVTNDSPQPKPPVIPGAIPAHTHTKNDAWFRVALWLMTAYYFALFCAFSLYRYNHFGTGIFDLGIFDQATWLISRGKPPILSSRGMNAFGDHFSPILYLIAPMYRIWDTPKTLLVLQTFACSIGAYPVYLMARKRTGSFRIATLFSIAYFLCPSLQGINSFDFHPESLAIPMLLFACWFLETKRPIPLILCLIPTLLCKETMGLTVICLGALAFFMINKGTGTVIMLLGALGQIISLETMRYVNHGQPSAYASLYSVFGATLPQIAWNLISHPLHTLSALFTAGNMEYVTEIIFPLGFLSLFAPRFLLPAVPAFLANMLSNRDSMQMVYFQYGATIIPFVFYSAIAGYPVCFGILMRCFRRHPLRVRKGLGMYLAYCVFLGMGMNLFNLFFKLYICSTPDDSRIMRNALEIIPNDASVSAEMMIGGRMMHRESLYMFPNPFQKDCWGNSAQALDQERQRDFTPLPPPQLRAVIARTDVQYVVFGIVKKFHYPLSDAYFQYFARIFLTDPHYGVVWANKALILQRGANYAAGWKLLRKYRENRIFLQEIGLH